MDWSVEKCWPFSSWIIFIPYYSNEVLVFHQSYSWMKTWSISRIGWTLLINHRNYQKIIYEKDFRMIVNNSRTALWYVEIFIDIFLCFSWAFKQDPSRFSISCSKIPWAALLSMNCDTLKCPMSLLIVVWNMMHEFFYLYS